MMRPSHPLCTTASILVLSFLAWGQATAQTAPKASKPAPDDEILVTSVTQIVVTAQKREQSLQNVPVTVTSLSRQLLQNNGVRDIKDMQVLTPGLLVTSTANESITTARLRGIGTVGDNPGLESSVGIVIDGVYRPRNGVAFGDLGELQRVEVLKGPQGTLFGKNTSAGVINITTEPPSFHPSLRGEATFGNFNAHGASVTINGPILDGVLAGRLYAAARERDGFYKVATGKGPRTATDDQNQDFRTLRGQLLYVLNDQTDAKLSMDYTDRTERCCAAVQLNVGPTAPIVNQLAGGNGIALSPNPYSRQAYANRGTEQAITDKGLSLEINHKIPAWDAKLTSISALRNWRSDNAQDIDFSGMDLLYRNKDGQNRVEFKTFSQELRLAGKTEKLDWLVGAFYADERLDHNDGYILGSDFNAYMSLLLSSALSKAGVTPSATFLPTLTGLPLASNYVPGYAARDSYRQRSKALALFTNESYRLTPKLELSLGLRWTQEDKSLDTVQINPDGGATCAAALGRSGLLGNAPVGIWGLLKAASPASIPGLLGTMCLPWANPAFNNRNTHQSREEEEWTGTLKASYRFNPSVMTYAAYARGYKAGGYNLDRVQTGLTPDASTAFKGEFVDSYELGIKSNWLKGTLLLNATYFDQTFTDFQLNTFLGTAFAVETIPELTSRGVDGDFIWLSPVKGLTFQGGVTYTETRYSRFTASQLNAPSHYGQLSLLPGSQLSFAPKWSASVSSSYERRLDNGLKVLTAVSARYNSDYNTGSDLLPAKQQKAYTLINARLGLGAANDRWMLELWAQNLTDTHYKQVVFNSPLMGTAMQSTPQPNGTYYNPALDTQTYAAYLGAPRTYGLTLRVKY